MIRLMMEHFSSPAARIIYMQKFDFVTAMIKAGVIHENEAENELARILERSLIRYGFDVPELIRVKNISVQ